MSPAGVLRAEQDLIHIASKNGDPNIGFHYRSGNIAASVYARSPKRGTTGPLKYFGEAPSKYLPTSLGMGPFESMRTKGVPCSASYDPMGRANSMKSSICRQ